MSTQRVAPARVHHLAATAACIPSPRYSRRVENAKAHALNSKESQRSPAISQGVIDLVDVGRGATIYFLQLSGDFNH